MYTHDIATRCTCLSVINSKRTNEQTAGLGRTSPLPGSTGKAAPGGLIRHQRCASASPRLNVEPPTSRPGGRPASVRLTSSLRRKREAWCWPKQAQKKKDDVESVELSPGYTLTRGKNHFAVTLGEELFGLPSQSRKTITEDLKEQIGKLTALLEDEKRSHQETRRKLTEEAESRVQEIEQKHDAEIRQLLHTHRLQVMAMEAQQKQLLEEEMACAEERYGKLEKEHELMKSSFRAYKDNLSEEMELRWNKKEIDWRLQSEKKQQNELLKQKQELMGQFLQEKDEMRQAFESQISALSRSHHKETEELHKQYRKAVEEGKLLDKAREEITALTLEAAENKALIIKLNAVLKQTQQELLIQKGKLAELEKSFNQKISAVDNRHRNRLHALMNENTDLRRKFFSKCEELYEERAKTEQEDTARLRRVKEKLLSAIQQQESQASQNKHSAGHRPTTAPHTDQ
ncbi:AL2SB protein, partial [Atractosteus spatula]|nr:AL2SB protein [Atractosteus spatula]